ncbi:MAG: hypothetical protein A2W20_06215 [Candidatus Aminicenantes bacterium RBG_16_66_30]|nr:MAG: hypothetical protein A2W20_06215 [Candidatus Aminicenantes bacterium RBG_16_66_30]
MRRQAWLIPVLAALAAIPAAGQTTPEHYYDVDKEVRFEGAVREIVLEPRYKGSAPFLVLRVEESGQKTMVTVEISPSWFFGKDIHGGEKVKGIGSLSVGPDGTRTIIARELQFRGETVTLRDKRGFPSWQGGPRWRRGIRRFGGL